MQSAGRDELVCDFAETYHIYDYRLLPARLAATYAAGLRQNSRIKMKMSGSTLRLDEMLLALIEDTLAIMAWQNTEDGQHNRNKPKSILTALTTEPEEKSDAPAFESPEAFKAWRDKFVKEGE